MKVPLANDFNRGLKHFLAFSENFLELLDKKIAEYQSCIVKVQDQLTLYPPALFPARPVPTTQIYDRRILRYEKLKRYYQFMIEVAKEEYKPSSYSEHLGKDAGAKREAAQNELHPPKSYSYAASAYRTKEEHIAANMASHGSEFSKSYLKEKEYNRSTLAEQKAKAKKRLVQIITEVETTQEKRARLKREYFDNRAKAFASKKSVPKPISKVSGLSESNHLKVA
ncbi:MAG: hypothetical protein ABIQ31_11145 [Ferruginibacter sp.]